MYCKFCGSRIPDDCIFCSKCGKKQNDINELSTLRIKVEDAIKVENIAQQKPMWIDTTNLQWKKPWVARIVQFTILAVSLFLMIWGIVWIAICQNRVNDWGIEESLFFVGVYSGFDSLSLADIIDQFRCKVLWIYVMPSIFTIVMVCLWLSKIPFKQEKLIRDYADKIEYYNWNGFKLPYYVFFKKGDKYGVLDVSHYCVKRPAVYEDVLWRKRNKTFDAMINGVWVTLKVDNQNN